MFYRERETTAKTLEELRFDLCCYMSRHFCDCKYGYKGQPDKMTPIHPMYDYHGEQTGCPELRSVISLLNFMTDEEFDEIMKRGYNFRL